jgi:hypothetical protein
MTSLIFNIEVCNLAYRKYQSVIYWEKSRCAKFDLLVGNLKRKHLDFANHVPVFCFDLVNQHTHFMSPMVRIVMWVAVTRFVIPRYSVMYCIFFQ